MKKIKILCVVALTMTLACNSAFAFEDSNRDANHKVVRGPYLTNNAGSNWWLGVAGGITVFGDGGYQPVVTPALDLTLGKWFTPSIAARIGYQGLTGAMWSPKESLLSPTLDDAKGLYKAKFGYAYLHADLMWNILNTFSGYKETRFWNLVPYVHTGILMTYKTSEHHLDNELAAGLGLYNTMRLSNRVGLSLDLRGMLVNGRHHMSNGVSGELSLTLGVVVNLGKTGFTRSSNAGSSDKVAALELANKALKESEAKLSADKAALAKENSSLEKANASLAKSNEDLKDENEDLKSQEPKVISEKVNVLLDNLTSQKFFFRAGATSLSEQELMHLDVFMNEIFPNVKNGTKATFIVVTDSNTGSKKLNNELSNSRADYVRSLLSQKYGLDVNVEKVIKTVDQPKNGRVFEIRFK